MKFKMYICLSETFSSLKDPIIFFFQILFNAFRDLDFVGRDNSLWITNSF